MSVPSRFVGKGYYDPRLMVGEPKEKTPEQVERERLAAEKEKANAEKCLHCKREACRHGTCQKFKG